MLSTYNKRKINNTIATMRMINTITIPPIIGPIFVLLSSFPLIPSSTNGGLVTRTRQAFLLSLHYY